MSGYQASPTIELYVKSYNAVAAIDDSVNAISYPTAGSYGYTFSTWPASLTTSVNGIYNKSGSENNCWLASPTNGTIYEYTDFCFYVNGWTNLYYDYVSLAHSVRPVVCIPTSEIGSTYHLES